MSFFRLLRLAILRSPFTIAALTMVGVALAGQPPSERRNFIACPILQDTPTVPCWVVDYQGERYFLGIQTDSAGWSPPWLGHRVLVEGEVAGPERICGGIPLTSQYLAPGPPSGSSDGRKLPNPPVISVMRELDASCNALLPADPRFHIEGRRGPGPNTAASAFRPPPPAPVPVSVSRPHEQRTFRLTYEFDSELASLNVGESLRAVQYAQAIHAHGMTLIGHRGATLLSDGTQALEIAPIAKLRAQNLAQIVQQLGLPKSVALSVTWTDSVDAPDGISDPDHRLAEIIVTP